MLRLHFLMVLFVTIVVLSPLSSDAVSFTFRGFWGSNASCGVTNLVSRLDDFPNAFPGCDGTINDTQLASRLLIASNADIISDLIEISPANRGTLRGVQICIDCPEPQDPEPFIPMGFSLDINIDGRAERFSQGVFNSKGASEDLFDLTQDMVATFSLFKVGADDTQVGSGMLRAQYTFIVDPPTSSDVPEPGTWLLMGTGLGGVLAYVRRNRQQTR